MRRTCAVAIVGLAVLGVARTSHAVFHLAVIDEVLTSYGGDGNVQFVEMRMLSGLQNFVGHSVFAAFDSSGAYVGDILEVPGNVTNSGSGVRWLIGTAAFQTESGVTPDFIMPPGVLRTGGGMVCFGGGGGVAPQNPPNWDRTNFASYVDCLAYGNYSGSPNVRTGTPTALDADGHALQRMASTNNNANDFACADPATPQNNAGDTAALSATSSCAGGDTPTPTVGETSPTPTPTGAVSDCIGDCNGDLRVMINELIIAVNIALGSLPLDACPSVDCFANGMVTIPCVVQCVNNALNGCPAVATPTRTPGGALGVRRFSIDPEQSAFIAVIGPNFPFPTTGFEGFLEMTAGPPNGGLAFIDLTDASDYLSINIPVAGTAVCLKILRDQLPIRNAGIISCDGGIPMGIAVTQDHNLGVVGACSGGASAGADCASDTDCPQGVCYSAALCAAAGGVVEGPTRPHPGTCNGAFIGVPDTEVSVPGTVVLAPVPGGFITGIPVELGVETSTPCGDEGITGMPIQIGFTSGHSVSKILNFNNEPGAVLEGEIEGEPFSCDGWADEDGPGTLVLSATNLDTQISPGMLADIVAQFRFVD